MAPPKASTKVKAPAGYREVDNALNGFWKPRSPGDFIEGIVGHRIDAVVNGKPSVFFSFKLADDTCDCIESAGGKKVAPDAGMLVGIGGATLRTFLEERSGKAVYIVFKGMGNAKPGQSAPKLYATFEQGESD